MILLKVRLENSASHHNRHHNPQSAGVIAGNDVDHVFAGHTADQPQGSAENAQKQIKKNSPYVTEAVAEDPISSRLKFPERSRPSTGKSGCPVTQKRGFSFRSDFFLPYIISFLRKILKGQRRPLPGFFLPTVYLPCPASSSVQILQNFLQTRYCPLGNAACQTDHRHLAEKFFYEIHGMDVIGGFHLLAVIWAYRRGNAFPGVIRSP